jgi:hypothetical protein
MTASCSVFDQNVHIKDGIMYTPYEEVKMISYKDPAELPWNRTGY